MNPTAIEYLQDLKILKKMIISVTVKTHAIVALKRSGWIVGAYLSNQLNLPVFSPSEINSIPSEFTHILVVDDKMWSGKSMQKVLNKLWRKQKSTLTAVLYLEDGRSNLPGPLQLFVQEIPRKGCRMWYESKLEPCS